MAAVPSLVWSGVWDIIFQALADSGGAGRLDRGASLGSFPRGTADYKFNTEDAENTELTERAFLHPRHSAVNNYLSDLCILGVLRVKALISCG
jgi:hypothetical protein